MSNLSVQAVEVAFTNGVEALCKNPALSVEVTSEVQLVATVVVFVQFTLNSVPSLKDKVLSAARSFLHSHTDNWVSEQGGWVSSFSPFVQSYSSRKLAVEVWLVISLVIDQGKVFTAGFLPTKILSINCAFEQASYCTLPIKKGFFGGMGVITG